MRFLPFLIFCVPIFSGSFTHAQPAREGLIPLNRSGRPSSDLVYQGRVLRPEDAAALPPSEDISFLNPPDDSSIWQNTLHAPLIDTQKELELKNLNSLQFISKLSSRYGVYRFSVSANDAQGLPHLYTITLSKTAHNILLRKNLLKKLGYTLPAIQFLAKTKLVFNDAIQKKLFIDDIETIKLFTDHKRWVTDESKETEIELQDAIITEEQDIIYNLSNGYLDPTVIKNRRLLSALLVPYALVEIPESVNIYSWKGVSIIKKSASFDYPDRELFETTYEDARWIISRIAKLTEQDWFEIVEAAHFPKEPAALILEKLKSRVNSLYQPFDLPNEQNFTPDFKITDGELLVKGKLKDQFWDGYATRFSFGDPESPFNPGEIWAFAKSKMITAVIDEAVNNFNKIPYLQTDISKAIKDHQTELAQKMSDLAQNGVISDVPLGIWGVPTYGGKLIFSRELITGSYLGTDNLIQLSDSFGFQLSLGGHLGVDGIPANAMVSADAGVAFSRIYSHIKPLKSIKKGNRYPFKNAFITHFIHQTEKKLSYLYSDEYSKLDDAHKTEAYKTAIKEFKNAIEIGESIIITDSFVLSAAGAADVQMYGVIDLGVNAGFRQIVLSRIHLYRKGKDSFQIYRDIGNSRNVSIGVTGGIKVQNAYMPILSVAFEHSKGKAKTKFYPVELTDVADDDSGGRDANVEKLRAVYHTLDKGDIDSLSTRIKPFVLEHKFKQNQLNIDFLVLSYRKMRTISDLKITLPNEQSKEFKRDQMASTLGLDYENLTIEGINFLGDLYLKGYFGLGIDSASNPGYTLYGRAENRIATFEAEKLSTGGLKDQYVKLSHIWNGFRISKKGAQKIVDHINKTYGIPTSPPLFVPTTFNETESMLLYTITADIHLYDDALRTLEQQTPQNLRAILAKYEMRAHPSRVNRIFNLLSRFNKKGNSKALLKAVHLVDALLPPKALIEFLGGTDNVYVEATIAGFRKGDESGDIPIPSNAPGLVGSPKPTGPISAARDQIGITEGELLSSWILARPL